VRQRGGLEAAWRDLFLHTLNLILHPRKTIRALLVDPRRLAYGIGGVLVWSAVYIIGISLTLLRHPETAPLNPPVLKIALEQILRL
jgi:hypothetical protein